MEDKTKIFIEKAILKHGNRYDYSLVNYIHSLTKVKIICSEHGEFEQLINNHLKGSGCNKCSGNNKAKTEFLIKANNKHNYKYDYSSVNYLDNKTKIKILCLEHGEFEQTPSSHLTGCGCPKCGDFKLTKGVFIKKSNLKHENKYNYSLVNYINTKTKVIIICPIHGEFKQIPNHHLSGAGCPICNESRGEREIRIYLNKNKINYIRQKIFKGCKDKKPLPFDFYLPEYNTCIEYNGKQHYESVSYWGGDIGFEKQQKRDKIKFEYCLNNNIQLDIIKHNDNIDLTLKKYGKI